MTIINLTQHVATADQIAAGVVEPADKAGVKKLLDFPSPPFGAEVRAVAAALAEVAAQSGAEAAMIGGFLPLMGPLETALRLRGVTPLFSFTTRVVVEETLPDGGVKKTAVFRHIEFIEGIT